MAADTNPEDLQGGAKPGGTSDDRFERSDARLSGVMQVTILSFAFALLTAAGVWLYFGYANRANERAQKAAQVPLAERPLETHFQGPKNLQINTKLDMDLYRASSEKQLESYGWVNKDAGVAHIPIDRAMALVVERGLPTRPDAAAVGFGDQATSYPQDSSGGRTYRNSLR